MELHGALAESDWRKICAATRQHLESSIRDVSPGVPEVPAKLPLDVTGIPAQLLSPNVIEITESSPEQLIEALAGGERTSEEVTKAFLQRAGLASRLVNCITELMPERAIERARYLDSYHKEHGKPFGPLHGLPISAKEFMGIQGLAQSAAYVAWAGNVCQDSAAIFTLLEAAGAVFFARTTEPQTLMQLETNSNLFGETLNPNNTSLTAGGSSGGEGALLGLHGSCLGIGTDIGGSVRSPAANNGVYALKPTSSRLPLGGFLATKMGQPHIAPTIGPMSTSLAGLDIFMKAVLDQRPANEDPSLCTKPWTKATRINEVQAQRSRLRIGIMMDDGVVMPHPPILRVLNEFCCKLRESSDFEILDFTPLNHQEAWKIISALYFTDGGAEDREVIAASGEPMLPLSEHILKGARALKVKEIWDLELKKQKYCTEYLRHWNSSGTPRHNVHSGDPHEALDALLCPVGPGCAPPLGNSRYWGYTAQWNLLDYPCLVFPTGSCCETADRQIVHYVPRNEDDAFNHSLCESRYTMLGSSSLIRYRRSFEIH